MDEIDRWRERSAATRPEEEIEKALATLEKDPSAHVAWAVLWALLGEGPIYPRLVPRLESILRHTAKRGKVKAMAEGKLKEATQAFEKAKAQLRAFVEHPFHVVKNLFKHRKVRYRGLAKNTAQLHTLFALANLVLARRSSLT